MLNFKQIGLLLEVFQRGRSVSNPVAWKHGQIGVTALAPVLVVAVELVRSFGIAVPVTSEQLMAIAGLIIAAVNVVCTITTTTKIGVTPGELPPLSKDDVKSVDGAVIDVDPPATRASLGYERTGASPGPAKFDPNKGTDSSPVFGGISNHRDGAGS